MSIHNETEADTRAERIDPVLDAAGWGAKGSKVQRELTISPGRIQSKGKRARGLSADYVLTHKGQKLAVLEAKRAGISHREGVEQAKDYASRLGIRFAYATNGVQWYEIDRETGEEGEIDAPFPSPAELWQRTFGIHNDWRERLGAIDFESDGGKWEPRYYQHRAITEALEAIAQDKQRILLTLATGTGKTSIAFQIAWKLFQARWNLSREPKRRPRILFIADRNILADQAFGSFSAFDEDALTRIDPETIRKNNGHPPKNANIFFTIFHTFMTGEDDHAYLSYPPDFFDLIIIDECHRGGANDESTWRALLEYFDPAVQLGLTATPRRQQNGDTYAYFGEPVYTYTLREGIEDGFLTPFKVRQMASTIDDYVYSRRDTVIKGDVEVGDAFRESEFNNTVFIDDRELSRVQEFMGEIDQRQKTLVFCASQDHAALVRDFINQVKESNNPDYCSRVTADDGEPGETKLREFQNNDRTVPTILTTSRKLSTGVDAKNVRNIVLMRPIKSMIEFKQIIGRGTRTYEGKDYFTVYDFVKAHEKFQDPEWDGEPEPPEDHGPAQDSELEPEDDFDASQEQGDQALDDEDGARVPRPKVEIRLSDGSNRAIAYLKTTTYWSPDGRPVSAQEFLERLFGDLQGMIADEDQLRATWSHPETRQHFLDQLSDRGYDEDRLQDIRTLVDCPKSDLFDVLGYVMFDNEPKTRDERVNAVARNGLNDVDGELRRLLLDILEAYSENGIQELAMPSLQLSIQSRYGSAGEFRAQVADPTQARTAFLAMQSELYQ